MAETYDETTELANAREELLMYNGATSSYPRKIETTLIGTAPDGSLLLTPNSLDTNPHNGQHVFSTAGTNTIEGQLFVEADDETVPPPSRHLLIPHATMATVPVDDDFLEDLTQDSDADENLEAGAKNKSNNTATAGDAVTSLLLTPSATGSYGGNVGTTANAAAYFDEPEGVDGNLDDVAEDVDAHNDGDDDGYDDDEPEAARRRTEAHITFDVVEGQTAQPGEGEITEEFLDELMGRASGEHHELNHFDKRHEDGGEVADNIAAVAAVVVGTNPHPHKSALIHNVESEIDLAVVFPVSRLKRLFRAGWGDGSDARDDRHDPTRGGDVNDGASSTFSGNLGSPACPMVSAEAVAMISHAAALMLDDLVKRSAEQTLKRGKKTVTYDDLALVVNTFDRLAFLEDVIPSANPHRPLTFSSGAPASSAGSLALANLASSAAKKSTKEVTKKAVADRSSGKVTAAAPKSSAKAAASVVPVAAPPASAAATGLDIASFFKKK